jgi:hypothetical protein
MSVKSVLKSATAIDVAIFSALTIAITWPQAVSLGSLPDHHDAWFNVWRLAWIAHALATNPRQLFDANIFHPAAGTLAYSDAVLFQGAVAAPLIWCGLSPIVACNLLVLASFVFAGVACTALVRDLTGDSVAARLAGLAFACAPFRFDHYFHLELLWSGWLPLVARYGLRTVSAWRPRDVLLTALALLGQVLSCLYYGVIAGTVAAIAAASALVFARGAPLGRRAAMIALGAALLALPLAAYARPYLQASKTVGARTITETRAFDAAWVNYVAAPSSNHLYGWTYVRWGGNERQLFPGVVAVLLAGAAAFAASRRAPAATALALIVSLDLARGLHGVSFPLLRLVNPAVAGLRVPLRFHVFTVLALAVLVGLGAAAIRRRARPAFARALAPVAGLAMLVEYASAPLALLPTPVPPSPVFAQIARDPAAIVIHLPLPKPRGLPGRDPYYALLSIRHWRPIINGYSGFYPPDYRLALERAAEPSAGRAFDAALALGATHILIHVGQYTREELTAVEAALLNDPRLSPPARVDVAGEPVLLVRAAPANGRAASPPNKTPD